MAGDRVTTGRPTPTWKSGPSRAASGVTLKNTGFSPRGLFRPARYQFLGAELELYPTGLNIALL